MLESLVEISMKKSFVPVDYELYQNYPNPFSKLTLISYDLPEDVNVTIKIFDTLGLELETLVNNEFKKAGSHEIKWTGKNYASGVYIYRIEAGSFVDTKKMILIK